MFFVPGTTLVYDVKLPTPKEIHQKKGKTPKKQNSKPKHQTKKLPNEMSLHNDTKTGGKI